MTSPDVFQGIMEYGKSQGYDGLCNYECGCVWDNLMPCGHIDTHCVYGIKKEKEDDDVCNECEYREDCKGYCVLQADIKKTPELHNKKLQHKETIIAELKEKIEDLLPEEAIEYMTSIMRIAVDNREKRGKHL